ncbi:MAG: hypothetical protein HY390_04295 [Deltaproteobacteria bacterium]|nr:hypothetical protein [Deltaproteobacteria bacterium]
MKCRIRWMVLAFLFFNACTPSDEEVSINLNYLLGAFGLQSNIFHTEAKDQLGSIVFYHSPEVVARLAQHCQYEGQSRVVIQIQGHLAQELQTHMDHIFKGSLKFKRDRVVYIFGELAEDLFKEIKHMLTTDDLYHFEGKEIVVVNGAEAVSFVGHFKTRFTQYFTSSPKKLSRIFLTSYETAKQWTSDVWLTFFDGIRLIFVTNVLGISAQKSKNVVQWGANTAHVFLEGAGLLSIFTGKIWVFSFDSISKMCAYLSGAEFTPESVLIRKSLKFVAEAGYVAFYSVGRPLRHLSGEASGESGVFENPFLVMDVTNEALKDLTYVMTFLETQASEIVIGYVGDNFELIGSFLNSLQDNFVGDLLLFMGETITRTVMLSSLTVTLLVKVSGNGLAAGIGTLSVAKPLSEKRNQFEVLGMELEEDAQTVWHELLKLLRFR